jgi:hypothetical protein
MARKEVLIIFWASIYQLYILFLYIPSSVPRFSSGFKNHFDIKKTDFSENHKNCLVFGKKNSNKIEQTKTANCLIFFIIYRSILLSFFPPNRLLQYTAWFL